MLKNEIEITRKSLIKMKASVSLYFIRILAYKMFIIYYLSDFNILFTNVSIYLLTLPYFVHKSSIDIPFL